VFSPQRADRPQKQAIADKLKFNLLAEANNEVRKAFGVVYTQSQSAAPSSVARLS
jgi:peroxiredoxin